MGGAREAAGAQVDPLALSTLHRVRSPRATTKLAAVLVLLLVSLPVPLLLVPWRQNISGSGRVTAFHPLDRVQVLPAPVTGRLVRLEVQEGERVQQGQVLAEMADQDPQFTARLEQQFLLSDEKVRATRETVALYDRQLVFLEDVREQAISGASFELGIAIEKVRAAEKELEGAEAEAEQKRADRERKWSLFAKGIASQLDFQKAEAEALSARAKSEAAHAKVEQARNEERAKMAAVEKVAAEQQAKLESTRSSREEARAKAALAEKELTEAQTKLERQRTQLVVAPRAGVVLRVHAASSAELLAQGAALIELVPETDELAVELWVKGNDAPLISPGRSVRLQFEGWPAVQFAGWPSVAVGTFGGQVAVVDARANADGRFRLLVTPDPADEPWPDRRYLRQGGRATGWVLLEDVSLGYEIWRQLNAFPPSISSAPEATPAAAPKPAAKKGAG